MIHKILLLKNFASLLFLITISQTTLGQQKETGIYFTVKCNKHVPSQVVLLTSKSICLTGNPIIFSSDFASVSEVTAVNDQVYFDLRLTSKGYIQLQKLQTIFPNSEFAFVVEGDVFIIFNINNNKQPQSILRIQSYRNDIGLFILIQSRLKKLIASLNQK